MAASGFRSGMGKLTLSITGRYLLPAVLVGAAFLWFSVCQAYHHSYWRGTVYRAQSVELALLHRTLPTALSQLIIASRDDLIQKLLNSNPGMFWLVVTDPTGKSILYTTKGGQETSNVMAREERSIELTPKLLAQIPERYDLLCDPPPMLASADEPADNAKLTAQGTDSPEKSASRKVLGRIYYLRTNPPALSTELSDLLSGRWAYARDTGRGYLFITLSVMAAALLILVNFANRRRTLEFKQKQIARLDRELLIRRKALEHLTMELRSQKERKVWLEQEADHSLDQARHLKSNLDRLRDSFNHPAIAPLLNLRDHLEAKTDAVAAAPQNILDEIESTIPRLTKSAKTLQSQATKLNEYCQNLEEKLAELERLTQEAHDHSDSIRKQS
jgi:methyl-accepting chemotaxis protein